MLASWLAAALATAAAYTAPCPNGCSLKGTCEASGLCTCYPGWTGEDCAVPLRCPDDCNKQGACPQLWRWLRAT